MSETEARRIAYFSMEVGLDARIPTYSGGLGILAGDTLKSCADLKIPVVGVTLLYRKGYFTQKIDAQGLQREEPVVWNPDELCRPLDPMVSVMVGGRQVTIRAYQYDVRGISGYHVPLLFLDTAVDENAPADRDLTSSLYGGDDRYRLAQEMILGVGGVRMLRALGYRNLERYHMNEGHASLLTLELLREQAPPGSRAWNFDQIRDRCVFTTHTPVPAGHDRFPYDLVREVIGASPRIEAVKQLFCPDRLNLTQLALSLSGYVNGVAKRHGQVSKEMFPGYSIESITNGVHALTWTCDSFRHLYDRHIPDWASDPFALRYAISIPNEEVWQAHQEAKQRLIDEVNRRTGAGFRLETLTMGFARRAAKYKRHDLIFHDPSALLEIARTVGPLQIVFGGKAHPKDGPGHDLIRKVIQSARQFKEEVKVAFLENYDMDLAKLVTSGVDVWLNTPLRPLEASGTSGMKAAVNGVPSFSVLDGWWIEGHVEGITGWSIGPNPLRAPGAEGFQERPGVNEEDARDLYRKLRTLLAPAFYGSREKWVDIMRITIAFNASFFNTHRMVTQYAANAYL